MLRQFSRRRIVAAFLLDWVGTLAMLALAVYVRAHVGSMPGWAEVAVRALRIPFSAVDWRTESGFSVPQVGLLVAVVWPLFFVALSVYDGRKNTTLVGELWNVASAVTLCSLVLAGLLFLSYRRASRLMFLIFVGLDLALLLGTRIVWWGYRRRWRGTIPAVRQRVLVVGAGPVGRRVVDELRQYAGNNLSLVGFVDDDVAKQNHQIARLPVLGTVDSLPDLVAAHHIQEAVVALPLRAHERLVSVCRVLQQLSVEVHVIPDLFALSFPTATLDGFGGIPVIHLGRPGLTGWRRIWKRSFDVIVAGAITSLLLPIMALIALAIRLESPGPVFFRQQRIGENCQPFTMLKFRSMKVGARPSLHQAHVKRLIEENISASDLGGAKAILKLTNDPRITRIGRIIRVTSLDELPQLFNVVRGDMSLVGPRPPLAYEVELYKAWHLDRLQAPPGITGLWQVKGRNRVSFDEMVRMDIEYIREQSVWLDIKILLQTPMVMLTGRGAR